MANRSKMERRTLATVLALCVGILTTGLVAEARTIRVYSPTGYADESTDEDGNLVRRNTFKDDGTPVKAEEIDPKTGVTTEETDYKDGKTVKQTLKNPDGTKVSETSTVYNEDGSWVETVQSYDEDGFTADRVVTVFGPDGKPKTIDIHGPGGVLKESTAYQYYEDGTLMVADRTQIDDEGGTEESFVRYDENGNVIQEYGNIDGIKGLPKPTDPNTKTQVGPDGTRTIVRYNPDGSIDVWIYDKHGNIRGLQYFQSGTYHGFPRYGKPEQKVISPPPVTIASGHGPSQIGALAVSYDSHESWEGGTTPLDPVTSVPTDDPEGSTPEVPPSEPISQGPGTLLALPDGWDVCGPGCEPPGTGGPPHSPEVWCTTTSACKKRGPDCGCHLFRKNRKGPKKEEYVAKPRKKMKSDLTNYSYHCHCVHPTSTSASDAEAPAMSISQPPVEEPREQIDLEPPPEESNPEQEQPPQLPSYLTVKATQSVLMGGAPASSAVAQATIKLEFGEPDLPVVGNVRDVDTGAGDDPIQGLTGDDGTIQLEVSEQTAAAIPASYVGNALEVDLTPRQSSIVQIGVDPDKENWADPGSYLHSGLLGYVTRSYLLDSTMMVTLHYPAGEGDAVEAQIEQSENVIESEPNHCRGKQRGPSDPYFKSKGTWEQPYDDQWAIKRVGFTAESDSAWKLMKGKASPVVVAVIDTGLDWNHKDISWNNIWTNDDEIPDNGIDDDGNGYVDDIIGWDFFRNDHKPWDHDGHGTFVSGVIAATQDNDIGIAGIDPNAKIMVLKALNSFGGTRASYLAEAIVYAADNGAQVINLSVGGKDLTHAEQKAIDHAHAKGVVIVVSAGNEGTDVSGFGPAGAENVITVAALDPDDKRAVFSNWGAAIDIAAPGMDVLSLRARRTDLMRDIEGVKYEAGAGYVGEDRRYFRASGTSMSAPIVAGVASLILSHNSGLSNVEVERMLLHSASDIEVPGVDQHTGYGLVDARAALSADPRFFVEAAVSGVEVTKVDGKTVVRVVGTANASGFARAWVEIGAGKSPTQWKKVAQVISTGVRDGALADIEAENFRNSKQWVIRVITETEGGKRREARFNLNLG